MSRCRVLLPAALAIGAATALAWEDGAPPATSGGFGEDDCSACHADNAVNDPRGALTIDGLPPRYRPGQRYTVTIALRHPALESGGFQLSARTANGSNAGTFSRGAPRVGTIDAGGIRYAQHTADGRAAHGAGAIRWTLSWQAPACGGELVWHLAANAANDDLSALGDYIYTLERRIAAAGATPCD